MSRTKLVSLLALTLFACAPRQRAGSAAPAPMTAVAPAPTTPAVVPAPTTTAVAPAPTTTATPPPVERPLLPPLTTAEAKRAEVRAILTELIAALTEKDRTRVKGIPLAFDPDEIDINAFAGCEKGAPYMAATAGFITAADAVAQTLATDELFKTATYDEYTKSLPARLAKDLPPTLPTGAIPANLESDPKRQSRAREIYGDLVAFTFGHELAHHYLGHTGCANGQPMGPGPAVVGHIVTSVIPVLNQPIELAADTSGTRNVLGAGRVRRPSFEWSERGGLLLFDFFGRLEANAPLIAKLAFLRSHPDSKLRTPFVHAAAKQWRAENP